MGILFRLQQITACGLHSLQSNQHSTSNRYPPNRKTQRIIILKPKLQSKCSRTPSSLYSPLPWRRALWLLLSQCRSREALQSARPSRPYLGEWEKVVAVEVVKERCKRGVEFEETAGTQSGC